MEHPGVLGVWRCCPAQGGRTPRRPVWGAVSCLGCHSQPPRLWRSPAEPPPPGQDFCTHLTTPCQQPSSLGRDAHPVGAPRGARRARSSPPHGMSPALCPRDNVSPPPATLAPCLRLLFLRGLPTGTRVSRCPGVSSFPAMSPVTPLPTAPRHHGQRCFSLASTWDGAQNGRYFALAKAFGQAGPGRCAGKQGLCGHRVVVPTAVQESLSRLLCTGQAPLSFAHPAWAHGAVSGHCLSVYPLHCLSQHPNPSSGGAPQCSPQATPAPLLSGGCRTPAGHGNPGCAVISTALLTPRFFPARLSQGAVGGRNRGELWRCLSPPPAPVGPPGRPGHGG